MTPAQWDRRTRDRVARRWRWVDIALALAVALWLAVLGPTLDKWLG